MWYKRKEANGAEKARRENYESYLYLPFTLPLSTLNLTFTYPLPTPVFERQCGIKKRRGQDKTEKLKRRNKLREREIRVESFGEPNIDVLPEEVRNAFFFSLLQKITECHV